MNPVLGRELVERVRGVRATVVLTVWLLAMTAVVYLVYESQRGTTLDPYSGVTATRSSMIGRSIFEWLVFFMVVLVLFVVPGLLSGAVAGERERQTLVPLQVTLLRPRSIVLGKIGSALAFVLLLLAATTPMLALSYLVGGIAIGDVFQAVLVLMLTTVALACITIACSSLFKRVQTATVVAYGVVLVLAFGSILAFTVAKAIDQSRGTDRGNPPEEILLGSPLVAVADVIGGDRDPFAQQPDSPFNGIRDWVDTDPFADGFFIDTRGLPPEVAEQIAEENGIELPSDENGVPFWVKSMAALGVLSLLSVAVASRRVRTPAKSER